MIEQSFAGIAGVVSIVVIAFFATDPARSSTRAEEYLMKSPAWIAGSLLILAMTQTTQAQQERLVQVPQTPAAPAQLPPPVQLPPIQWPLARPTGMDLQPLFENPRPVKRERLTPEERQRLRQDINEAGRELYRHESRRF